MPCIALPTRPRRVEGRCAFRLRSAIAKTIQPAGSPMKHRTDP